MCKHDREVIPDEAWGTPTFRGSGWEKADLVCK